MPKKALLLFVMVLVIVVPIIPAYANAAIALDGLLLDPDEAPFVIENNVMVPIRPLFKEMGFTLSCDVQEGLVQANGQQEKIVIHLWKPELLLNGEKIKLTAAPQLVEGRVMLSLQDLCELLKLKGLWDVELEQVSMFSTPKMTKEGVVRQLLAADRQMMRAEYFNNQEFLAQCRVAPSPQIKDKEDLVELLGRYWDAAYINNLWQAGSKNGSYEGFFSEGTTPLIYSKEIEVIDLTETGAVVQVKLPLWGEEGLTNFEQRYYTLNLDQQGRLLVTNVELIYEN